MLHTSQLAVIQFESVERVGAVEQHMALCMDWLQLLQSGFTATNTLYRQGIFISLSHLIDAVETGFLQVLKKSKIQ